MRFLPLNFKKDSNQKARISLNIQLIGTTVLILVLGIVCYGFYTGYRLVRVYTPLVNAAMEIKLDAALAHLWFEEIMGGDSHEDIETVWARLNMADWYAKSMLEGGKNPEGTFMPLRNNEMRQSIKTVRTKLAQFKDLTNQRLEAAETSGIGTKIDQNYDDVFEDFLNHADEVQTELQNVIGQDLISFRYTQIILIVACLMLLLFLLIAFSSSDRRRARDFLAIQKAKDELEEQIKERKRIEEALSASEQKFRLIAENIQDVFWINTPGIKEMIYVSPAYEKIWGSTQDSLYQSPQSFLNAIHPEDRDEVLAGLKKHEEGIWEFEYRIIRPDCSVRWIHDRGFPVYDDHGDLRWMIGVAKDITNMKKLERQLVQSEKLSALGMMVSAFAHEINNPNNFISFNIPILREYLLNIIPLIDDMAEGQPDFELFYMSYPEFREDLFKLLENIEHGSSRINRIVSDLKEFSRRTARINQNWIDIEQVIKEVVAVSGPKIKKMGHSFEINVSEDMPQVYTDPEIVNLILVKLLNNAAQAVNKENCCIKLNVASGDTAQDHLILEVCDNGCGIDEKAMKKIFEPFFTTNYSKECNGLGLYVCHSLAEQIGARIEVESEPGQGSTFRVIITDSDTGVRNTRSNGRLSFLSDINIQTQT